MRMRMGVRGTGWPHRVGVGVLVRVLCMMLRVGMTGMLRLWGVASVRRRMLGVLRVRDIHHPAMRMLRVRMRVLGMLRCVRRGRRMIHHRCRGLSLSLSLSLSRRTCRGWL